jgi:NAD(P) transhydrogenase subunit alpha
VAHRGVTIIGAVQLPSRAPFHASQMYATNIVNLLKLIVNKEGALAMDRNDEIVRESLVTFGGAVVHPKVVQLLDQARIAAGEGMTG